MYFKILLLILIFLSKITRNYKLDGIYNIKNIDSNLYFGIKNKKIILTKSYKYYFRIENIFNNCYKITTIFKKLSIGLNDFDELILDKNIDENITKFQWNIIKISKNQYVIQNAYNNRTIEVKNNEIKLKYADDLIINNKNLFLFYKLCEEYKYKDNYEFLKNTLKEPIDVIMKYIDLNDKTLNRTGINQTYKDEDNEELRYSLKSIFEYIPWVRKIFILMPNKLVKYLKSTDEINDKIIYINDKDLLGYDSANIQSFLFNLHKIEKFGSSKNFIYIEDDYFIGKKLSKLDFFYYEEKENKVVPFIISYMYFQLNKSLLFDKYFELKGKVVDPHTNEGFRLQIYNTNKFILEKYNKSLIEVLFTHNSIPENIDDLKEIFNESNKYEYINATLISKHRHVQSLCHQQFLNMFNLNIKKRKAHFISSIYLKIENTGKTNLKKKKLFVINTSGDHKPLYRDYKIQRKILSKRFTFDTIYDIKNKNNDYKFFKSIYNSTVKLYFIFFLFKFQILYK